MKRIKREILYLVTFLLIVGCIFGGLFFVLKTGKNINVLWSDTDFVSACKKTYLVFDEKMSPSLNIVDEVNSVDKNIEATLSSAELTALANKSTQKYNVIKDLNIKLEDNGIVELSFVLGDNPEALIKLIPNIAAYKNYLDMSKGSPVYVKALIDYEGNKGISVKVLSLSIGQINISAEKANSITPPIVSRLTSILSNNKFDINELSINDDMFYYKASLK